VVVVVVMAVISRKPKQTVTNGHGPFLMR